VQLQEISMVSPASSQYWLQYLVSSGVTHLQAGCAHFLLSAIIPPEATLPVSGIQTRADVVPMWIWSLNGGGHGFASHAAHGQIIVPGVPERNGRLLDVQVDPIQEASTQFASLGSAPSSQVTASPPKEM
jgi:hypothetical protein